jgi:hypothetical protein
MTSSEDADAEREDQPLAEQELEVGARRDDLDGFEKAALDEIRDEHGLGDAWEPRFAADTPRAEQKAEEYRELGFEARVFPHPEDVSKREIPERGDRCVVYTREKENDDGGMIDEDIL